MKSRKVLLLIMLVALFSLFSGACGGDGNVAGLIAGKWETEVQGVFVVYEFTVGGDLILHLPDGTSQSVGTYEVDGTKLTLTIEGETATTTLAFPDDNTLTMIDNDAEYLYTRVE